MINAIELNSLLFRFLDGRVSINGGVYIGDDRPDNSRKEDITVNTIDITMDSEPQAATSNINIYVPDVTAVVEGNEQLKADRRRLRILTAQTIKVLRETTFPGLKMTVSGHNEYAEKTMRLHYSNIRVEWNIVSTNL